MIKKAFNYLYDTRDRQRICIALSKGGAMMQARNIDLTRPLTWEFSGFSQNGEDGILDVLRSQLLSKNSYFLEIGAGDGIENNTGWLLVAEKNNGIMVDGNRKLIDRARRSVAAYCIGSQFINMFVTKETVKELLSKLLYQNPDVFSLDIDGNDYYIARQLFEAGFRPKICVVEYNSVYGADNSLTVEYKEDFSLKREHPTELYYGVSITGWKNFFESIGYQFITVDSHGVNGFFIDPQYFCESFVNNVDGLLFSENLYQEMKFGMSSEDQFLLIKNKNFYSI